jgi:hypothetical protein
MKPNYRKKYTRKKGFRGPWLFLSGSILAVALLATLYIWQRMETVRLVKAIGQLEKSVASIEKEKEYLALESFQLDSPGLVVKRAQETLGFNFTAVNRQIAVTEFNPEQQDQSWDNFLAKLKEYSQKAWQAAEPEAIAGQKND